MNFFRFPDKLNFFLDMLFADLFESGNLNGSVGVDTIDKKVRFACSDNLEILAGDILVENGDLAAPVFPKPETQQEPLMEGHFGREVLLGCADQEELIGLGKFDDVGVTDDEMAVKNIFSFVFHSLELDVDHILKHIGFKMP